MQARNLTSLSCRLLSGRVGPEAAELTQWVKEPDDLSSVARALVVEERTDFQSVLNLHVHKVVCALSFSDTHMQREVR